jgi:hypothetical protein
MGILSTNVTLCLLQAVLVTYPEIFFEKYSINTDTHTHINTYPYKHTHAHSTPMNTSERLSRHDIDIHEVGHQECLIIDGDVTSH